MPTSPLTTRHLYWLDKTNFLRSRTLLQEQGYTLSGTLLTPCQVLHTSGKNLVYGPPGIWSRICVRQGSWYRDSKRNGQFMIMSDHPLPGALNRFLDSKMSESDFKPESLPDNTDLQKIVDSETYQASKPGAWEGISWWDALMFKTMFTVFRFWGRGDSLKKFWLSQRANHANFLSREYTTEKDGQQIPYSVTENAGVCSSCVEFFNVIETDSRKLSRACPGAVIFGGAKREIYYDVKPVPAGRK